MTTKERSDLEQFLRRAESTRSASVPVPTAVLRELLAAAEECEEYRAEAKKRAKVARLPSMRDWL